MSIYTQILETENESLRAQVKELKKQNKQNLELACDWIGKNGHRYVRMNKEMIWMSADFTEDFRKEFGLPIL